MQVWKRGPDSRPKKRSRPVPVETTESLDVAPDPPRARMPPPSTMVSSPVRARSKRAKTPSAARDSTPKYRDDDPEPGAALHANGYEKDDFVVSDEDDAFEPVPPQRLRPSASHYQRQQTLHELGPPISKAQQKRREPLDEIHESVVESFLNQAKDIDEALRNRNGLRRPLFTEQQFRDMATDWTTSKASMCTVSGVDKEKVDKYGDRFLELLNYCHKQYREMMGISLGATSNSAVEPSNTVHDVVDLISSDDEEVFEGDDIDFNEEEEEEEEEVLESSRFFHNGEHGGGPVAANTDRRSAAPSAAPSGSNWYEQFERLSSQQPTARAPTAAAGTATAKRASGSGWKGSKRSYGKKYTGRPRANSAARSTSSGAVTKRKTSGARRGPSTGPGVGGAKGRGSSSTGAKKALTSGIATMPF